MRWASVAVGTLIVVLYGVSVPGALTDLEVYRAGGSSWLHGVPLYTDGFPFWLPFTYPPVSAVLFGVLAILPLVAAAVLLTAAGLVGLSVTTRLAVPSAPLVVGLALALEPIRTTLMFGQVNLVLMATVALDCLSPRTRWPRGLLIGVAAAVKLTPAVFVLFFLARRQVQPAVTAVVTFAAASGAGMLFAPADSVRYWHTTLFDPDRIGGAAFATNQSLRGALVRLGLPDVWWVVLVLVVLGLAWRAARRTSEPVVALLVVAAAGLLASPVSWSHHWVWIGPALVYFAVRLYRNRGAVAVLVGVAVVFAVGHRYLPHARDRELEWTWWQHVLGNSYLLVAMAFLAWSAMTSRPRWSDAKDGRIKGRHAERAPLEVHGGVLFYLDNQRLLVAEMIARFHRSRLSIHRAIERGGPRAYAVGETGTMHLPAKFRKPLCHPSPEPAVEEELRLPW